ncbi:probable H/ACA ribonucleoprotein complex subunit 4 [Cucurbita maxima]|uniref:Probable H/ACA ribonucleoprotein complex subunit 4 n=1 Tax=Cucurbita maxima TaxID=3661 RepID=A0A6J1KUZ8_CUCMA|nr:probable H/ACA ribonucleoprotein complex subunit 4 [Cucurbita maxima]XP_023006094.1 probable H/ACA ribonucleoprotein complex subunit 4 [Cucurbita maxima]XP_023006095.1 probable H/ACA ribonucleoprotein complex subunit 4 [Cucurbita maxima]XP_023006097.1 probable H/ACA ribonucleoprotein complex subunit 4 [Cucurbita maxima]
MGGKGLRRRERNYRAAHGGYDRLPPPPNASQVDTLPSKLRKLMSFTSPRPQESEKVSEDVQRKRKREAVDTTEKKYHPKEAPGKSDLKSKGNGGNSQMPQLTGSDDDVQSKSTEKKNKKRKKKQVTDLRFEDLSENSNRRLKKRERQKKYHEAKKNKHKKGISDEDLDFPRHEKIKFGDVVEAPLKLTAVPKAFKSAQVASQERKRLQAITEYRNRKGWTSRPGLQIPSMTISPAV